VEKGREVQEEGWRKVDGERREREELRAV